MDKVKYKNGNYRVEIYDDGTKIRYSKSNNLLPEFPESIDIKITNKCNLGCSFCHENSVPEGNQGDLYVPFLRTLKPGTELAIGGGNPLEHPGLEEFLTRMGEQGVICNMTVNQTHFKQNYDYIIKLLSNKLIKGLGVSLNNSSDTDFLSKLNYPNIVLHTINGILTENDIKNISEKNIKVLVLGYKIFGRGVKHFSPKVEANMKYLYENIRSFDGKFRVMSFDNLAIRQLDMQRFFITKKWKEIYMGDDGEFTMYIDLVKKQFAYSSTADVSKRYPLEKNIKTMFRKVRNEKNGNNRRIDKVRV
jgi:MoaA/NifB/PqqE/SkfB family radical SAM enzyme